MTLNSAVGEVIVSSDGGTLIQILNVALQVGNVMNYNTSQGLAVGFPIEFTTKLKDTRSPHDRKHSLVNFLAR